MTFPDIDAQKERVFDSFCEGSFAKELLEGNLDLEEMFEYLYAQDPEGMHCDPEKTARKLYKL